LLQEVSHVDFVQREEAEGKGKFSRAVVDWLLPRSVVVSTRQHAAEFDWIRQPDERDLA
jgi:hypothetical protein